MAVPNVPFYMSQANTEFNGNGWGSDIRTKARLPAAGWLSELAGRTAETIITLTVGTSALTGTGFSQDIMGAISPNTHLGRVITKMYGRYIRGLPDQFYLEVAKPSPVTMTIDGFGSNVFPANVNQIDWPGSLNWINERIGQTVTVRLKSDS